MIHEFSDRTIYGRGYVVLLALVLFGVFLTVSTALINYATSYGRAERVTVASSQAHAIAEGALDKAVEQMNASSTYTGETNTALGAGTFTTTITSVDALTKRVTVTASVPSTANPTAQSIITSLLGNTGSLVHFDYSVEVGAGGLRMDNNSRVNGDMYSNGLVMGASGATITGTSTVTSAVSSPPDQEWLDQDGDFSFANLSSRQSVAQSFTPTVTDHLATVVVYLRKVGNPTDIHFRILQDDNGTPSNNQIDSGKIDSADVSTTYGFVSITLNTPILTKDQTYWIEMDAGVSSSKYYQWGIDSSGDYPNGTGMYTSNWDNDHAVWSAAGGDFMFITYMGTSPGSLTKVSVGGNAYAGSLKDCSVTKDAYYQSINNCPVSGTSHPGSAPAAAVAFPISDTQVTGWEAWAQSGGSIAGPYTVNTTASIGPAEINGDLTVNGTLTLKGTVWVNGKITFGTGATLKVDPSVGNTGVILIADNPSNRSTSSTVYLNNNVTMTSNGQPNNYILVVA